MTNLTKNLSMHVFIKQTCIFLILLIWLWPITDGPLPAMWPDLIAITAGIILLNLLSAIDKYAKNAISFGLIYSALISSFIALLQYYDLDNIFHPFIAVTDPGYAYANTRQINHFATLLGAGILAVLWGLKTNQLRTHSIWMLGPITIAMAATASRTGSLLMLVIFAISIWQSGHQRKKITIISTCILVLYFLAIFILPKTLEYLQIANERNLIARLLNTESSCSSRMVLWKNIFELIQLKPWLGWGPGELNYAHYINEFKSPRFCEKLTNAHNLPLHIAVSFGIPAALLFCTTISALIIRQKPWSEKNPTQQLAWGILLLISIHSLIEYPLWFGNFQITFLLCIWLLNSSPIDHTSTSSSKFSGHLKVKQFSLIAFIAITYVSFDYLRVSQLYTPQNQRLNLFNNNTFDNARKTWLFTSQVLFAQITTSTATKENSEALNTAALAALHVSPEPRIIEKVIESSIILNNYELAIYHATRYKSSYPDEFRIWNEKHHFE